MLPSDEKWIVRSQIYISEQFNCAELLQNMRSKTELWRQISFALGFYKKYELEGL